MITSELRAELTVPQLQARALEAHARADRLWDEWDAAGRPASETSALRNVPTGWLNLMSEAGEYLRALDDARWRIAIESYRWTRTTTMDPAVRPFYEAAIWEVTDGRRHPGPSSVAGMSTRLPALRNAAPLAVTS